MNWFELTRQQQFSTLQTMLKRGGSFASALAQAWLLADSSNSDALARAFPEMVRRYGPNSALHLEPKESADGLLAMPTAVIYTEGGCIHNVMVDSPMRVIVLDADVEGSDQERITVIDGEEFWVGDWSPDPLPSDVADVVLELTP